MLNSREQVLIPMAGHDLIQRNLASYPVSGTTNEKCKNISVRIAGLWAEIFDLRPVKYEADKLTTRPSCSATL